MSEVAIEVEGISKKYRLGSLRPAGTGLRHVINDLVTAPFQKLRGRAPAGTAGATEDFWALKDVSLQVKRGDVVGIVGRNGAGKSTLLKILSRITEPTSGRIRIRGRVASLLEVGTGFHPELTGRENIFLNGAILGMQRAEIKRKFDQIVAFAEVERFIDTPVKRYSSGMYVRLAFSVAAHLEPDILIVDEVLAVGDSQFQKKCLGKMEEVSQELGRTILFVSHNMGAVSQLCNRGVFLANGTVLLQEAAETVVSRYLNAGNSGTGGCWTLAEADAGKKRKVFFRRVTLLNHLGEPVNDVDVRFPFWVEMEYEVPNALRRIEMTARIITSDGRAVMTTIQSEMTPGVLEQSKQGRFQSRVQFPGMFLMPGNYLLSVAAHEPVGEAFHILEGILNFVVRDTGTVFTPYQHFSSIGVVMRSLRWEESSISTGPEALK